MTKRVLVVEDEEDVRTLLEAILSAAGYSAVGVRTAAAGRLSARSGEYDLVLTDWLLRDSRHSGDIIEAAVEAGAKAIIITGNPGKVSETERARFPVLEKPFRSATLIEAVTKAIGAADV
jgi:DNA-binding NtrC family response regulator